jgi:hypothetical protein
LLRPADNPRGYIILDNFVLDVFAELGVPCDDSLREGDEIGVAATMMGGVLFLCPVQWVRRRKAHLR